MSTDLLLVKIYESKCKYRYDSFELGKDTLIRVRKKQLRPDVPLENNHRTRRRIKIYVDGILVHYIVNEFRCSPAFSISFLEKYLKNCDIGGVTFIMTMPMKQIVDFDWNYRMNYLAREKCELDYALSWLSTLGGAFSALGDYSLNCAEIAGKISRHQLNLALRLKDPMIVNRCKLYYSLSLIQRGRFKLARLIIENEYHKAKGKIIIDTRLIKMCLGIWSKLQYEYQLTKQRKKLSRIKIS